MKRLIKQLKSYAVQLGSVMRNEYRSIFTDEGVILILVFATIIYAVLYSLAYDTQVLRNIPISVIDDSKSSTSRALVESLGAGPNTVVAYESPDMESAKELFFDREIYGVVYIPSNYEKDLLEGGQANVAVYVDASYFLMYRQIFEEVASSVTITGAKVEFQRLVAKGASVPQATATVEPVIYDQIDLFNPYLGYASFVIPAVLMVIIQQTLLIGIGMIGGTWREFGLYKKLIPTGRKRMSTIPIVLGKTIVYSSICIMYTLYLLKVHYKIFEYPANGDSQTIILFMIPYLLSSIFLGIFLSTLFQKRENSMLFMLWSSIIFLMLSGVSFPKQAIPPVLNLLAEIIPSTHGVDGFVRIQSMGASFDEVMDEVRMLWVLTVVYGGLACIGIHLVLKREEKRLEQE